MIGSIYNYVTGIVKVRGGTDNTIIGNDSDSLKVVSGDRSTSQTLTAATQSLAIDTTGMGVIGVDISGTWTGTVLFEARIANSLSYFAHTGTNVNALDGQLVTQATANGQFAFPVSHVKSFRVYCSALSSGSVVVNLKCGVSATVIHQLLSYSFVKQSDGDIMSAAGRYNATPPTVANGDRKELQVDVNGNLKVSPSLYQSRSDTYTATGNGTTVDVSTKPLKCFSIQVKATGAVTSWEVRLEGSLDNVNFTQILQHTNVTGDGAVLFTGATLSPCLYFRSRCVGLVLGAGTNIVTTILGVD